jgi:hypothetical protein
LPPAMLRVSWPTSRFWGALQPAVCTHIVEHSCAFCKCCLPASQLAPSVHSSSGCTHPSCLHAHPCYNARVSSRSRRAIWALIRKRLPADV